MGKMGAVWCAGFFMALAGMLFISAPVFAQVTYPVSGLVREAASGDIMPLVTVVVDSAGKQGTNTGLDGMFKLDLTPGKHILNIRYLGYKPVALPITIVNKPVSGLVINLQNQDINIGEVVVTPKNNPAIPIIRAVIRHKRYNRMDQYQTYEFDAYNKLVLSLDNIKPKDLDNPLFRAAKKLILAQGRDSLPGGLGEAIDPMDKANDSASLERNLALHGAAQLDSNGKIIARADTEKRDSLGNPLDTLAAKKDSTQAQKDSATLSRNPRLMSKDSLARYKLAIFVNETVSHRYFEKPNHHKEDITGSRTIGVRPMDISGLASLFTDLDAYDNYIYVLGKAFISPIADGAFLNYNYYLTQIEVSPQGDTTYHIELYPKRKYDLAFRGIIYIDAHTYALRGMDLTMNTDPNINFVEGFRVKLKFQQTPTGKWVPAINDFYIDFKNKDKKLGVKARAAVYMTHFELNKTYPPDFFANSNVEVASGAEVKDTTYWQKHEEAPLENSEKLALQAGEILNRQPLWRGINTALDFALDGTKRIGQFEFGPLSRIFGYNVVEGIRNSVGVYTNELFSDRWKLGGHIAYGYKDARFKYEADAAYVLLKKPRLIIGLNRASEIEQTGFNSYGDNASSIVGALLNRVPLRQLNYFQRNQLRLYMDVRNGLAATLKLTTKTFDPAFPYTYTATAGDGSSFTSSRYATSELGAIFRISFKERYIRKSGEKVYLETPIPVFYLEGNLGLKNFLGGEYNYQKIALTATNHYYLGRLGNFRFVAQVGQIFGALPYPSLFTFRGNQSYAMSSIGSNSPFVNSVSSSSSNETAVYAPVTFNLLYYYELEADRYAVFGIDHHFEGWILKKIPLVRKLKWKEIFSYRIGIGSLTAANKVINPQLETIGNPKAPNIPYQEIGFGIENIFKILQVNFVWRLNYHNPQPPAGLTNANYNFGIRFNLKVGF